METVKSRSESPFSKSKTKSSLSDASEIGSAVIEQIKTKKKSLRNKSKSQASGKENEDVGNNKKEIENTVNNGKENENAINNGKENENAINNGKENENVANNGKENENVANNGKENEDLTNTGKNFFEEEIKIQNEITNNDTESNNTEYENGIENTNNVENSNMNEEASQQEVRDKENKALTNECEIPEEIIVNESEKDLVENCVSGTYKSIKDITAVNIEEGCSQEPSNLETSQSESSAKKDVLVSQDHFQESEVAQEISEEIYNERKNDSLNGEANSLNNDQGSTDECSEIKETSQVSINGSDASSQYEEANGTDHIQESPDTATKDDISVTNKITSFLGKWGYTQEQKQDSEVSSSKKIEGMTFNHPYLSKVSGRRGIKERLNSSATVFSSKELEAKTPENSGISLNDSFRVRTNPPRLNSLDLEENFNLRKFKGKRCLNASGEPEGEDELYPSTMKRIKLDEKVQDPGLFGGLLWSPFKKRPYDDENQLKISTTESKLSRLLSPFWFWKKRAAGQKGK